MEKNSNVNNTFAVVKIQGGQFLVKSGEKITVNRINAEPGTVIKFDEVLFLRTKDNAIVGNPQVEGAEITAKVINHIRAPKVYTFKFIRRENYRRLKGHKQPLTELEVLEINYSPK
ncbi:MAG: 50S ribosomal protein L21 [candidate division WOR-3 bacterium]|nr:50S ribosomal protein L21 [candidate division WOR-3 bacterium]